MGSPEEEVARLLQVRAQDGLENTVDEENKPEQFEVKLEEVEKLQFENISIKRQLLQEQMNSTEYQVRDLVLRIKARCGVADDYDVIFDPQANGQIVRLVKSKGGTN